MPLPGFVALNPGYVGTWSWWSRSPPPDSS